MAPKAAPKAKATTATKKTKSTEPKAKRTPSPYILFCKEKRPELKEKHPNATFGEMGKMLGQMWGQMDEKAKAVSILLLFRWSHSSLTKFKFYIGLRQEGLRSHTLHQHER